MAKSVQPAKSNIELRGQNHIDFEAAQFDSE
jgi:hypothetical protein